MTSTYQSSPRMALKCTKSRTSSSHAVANPSSLGYGKTREGTESPSLRKRDSGNHGHQPREEQKHSIKPTSSMIYLQSRKPSSRCMQCVDTWSNQHGSNPSNPASMLDGRCLPQTMSRSTTLKQRKLQKET